MSTPLSVATREAITQWASLCPNIAQNMSSSVLFVKRYISLMLSTITYSKKIFSEKAYGIRSLEGVNIPVLSDHTDCPDVKSFLHALTGCFDALEKGYLQQLHVMISNADEDNPTHLEEIILKFNYNADGTLVAWHEDDYIESELGIPKETRIQTLRALTNLLKLSEKTQKLPRKGQIFVSLLYNDNVTPPDYEPPGFQSFDASLIPKITDSVNVKIGVMNTPFHRTSLVLKTTDVVGINVKEAPQGNMFEEPGSKLLCPCGSEKHTELMLMCSVCRNVQHGICFGVVIEDEAPEYHVCDMCADNDINFCATDHLLYHRDPGRKKAICIMRWALMLCATVEEISLITLMNSLDLSKIVAQELLQMMEAEGFVSKAEVLWSVRSVNSAAVIHDGFKKYLYRHYRTMVLSQKNSNYAISGLEENDVVVISEDEESSQKTKQEMKSSASESVKYETFEY